ncbi:glycosyltransferase family 4 protein [Sphingomonas immobilis]|uniref:Glycosyltransferase family 1 protein n=1 Tax=Sphingomonas immobilis TaxID=3063997 RepID=A0ABT8ZTM5_9SPHN|nr:glycosyltransferase family 1 protein [Sphingomonas sp. CA1-15]MDO7840916.1 glycosyltransferase family 1 protein [Sphingomonas sp. CA1-15]
MNLLAYVHLRNIYGSTGAGRVARNIVEALHALGEDNLQILCDRTDRERIVPLVGAPWDGFTYHDFTLDTSKQQARWLLTDRPKAESWWPEAELVYCTMESYVPTKRAKSVVTLHDAAFFEEDALARNFARWRQSLKWRLMHGKLARRADMFHTVSQFSADRLAHFFPAMRDRLRVVHNGVTDVFFAPPTPEGEAGLAALGLADKRFILLPRGLAYRKNADLVLAAWPVLRERHPDLMLVIGSHCDPAYAARAKAMGDGILLTGFVSDAVLRSLYGAAQLTWVPSLYEGFGIPILESMACGTAVVSTDTSSIPEVAGGAALLVDPHDRDAHIDTIDHLLHDAGARTALIARGHARAQHFTWSRAAETLRGYMADLL